MADAGSGGKAPPRFDNTRAVIVWAFVTGGVLAALAAVGLRLVAGVAGVMFLALAALLIVANWDWNSAEASDRRKPDRRNVIVALWVASVLPWIVLAATEFAGIRMPHGGKIWIPRAVLLTSALATAAICLSGLVDWSYIHPRLRGLRDGRRPCTTSTADDWKAVTSTWMRHRMIAYTIVRVAAVVVVALLVVGIFRHIPQPISSVLAGAAALVIAFILNRVTAIASLSQNPPLSVGDVVTLAEEYGTGVSDRPEYYVVDVAVEGIQLRELAAGRPVGPKERTHDRTLEIADVNRLLRVRKAFDGCAPMCCRVNKYCTLAEGDLSGPPVEPT